MYARRNTPVASADPNRPLVKRPQPSRFRTVLSIDGGGVRGIVPVMVLRHLETSIKEHIFQNRTTLIPEAERSVVHSVHDFDVDLTDYFDLVAGTSVGSWIAAYIAARGRGSDAIVSDEGLLRRHNISHLRPGSMELARIAFREFAREVFPKRNIFDRVRGLFCPKYSSKGLTSVLKRMFGDATMKDMEIGSLITAYDLGKNAGCTFLRGPNGGTHTVRTKVRNAAQALIINSADKLIASAPAQCHPGYQPDWDIVMKTNYRLRDITHASSAAPTYFSPARISELGAKNAEELILVDGGTVANNPALLALTYAPDSLSGGNIGDIAMFSVGCATVDPDKRHREDPGLSWWLTSGYLQNMLTEGTTKYIQAVIDYWLYKIMKLPFGQYMRIQKNAEPGSDEGELVSSIDVPDKVPELEVLGQKLAEDNDPFIKTFVKNFIFASRDS